MTFEQEAMPEAGEPGVPGEDRRRLPVGRAEGLLADIVSVAEGAGGSLVGSEDGPAARQRLLDLRGQRVGIGHTPFIRLAGAENRE